MQAFETHYDMLGSMEDTENLKAVLMRISCMQAHGHVSKNLPSQLAHAAGGEAFAARCEGLTV